MPERIKDLITAVMNLDTEDLNLEGFLGDIFGNGEVAPPLPGILVEMLYSIWNIIPEEIKVILSTVVDIDPAEWPLLLEGFLGEMWNIIPRPMKDIIITAINMDAQELIGLIESFIGPIPRDIKNIIMTVLTTDPRDLMRIVEGFVWDIINTMTHMDLHDVIGFIESSIGRVPEEIKKIIKTVMTTDPRDLLRIVEGFIWDIINNFGGLPVVEPPFVLPPEILPPEILPPEIFPPEILPPEILPPEIPTLCSGLEGWFTFFEMHLIFLISNRSCYVC